MRAEQFLYVNYVLQYVNGHADKPIRISPGPMRILLFVI